MKKIKTLPLLIMAVFLVLVSVFCDAANVYITGKIMVVGNAPFTRLVCQTPDNQQITLLGDIRAELGNLQGVVVRLQGEKTKEGFRVIDYQILDVGGGENPQVPWVGILKTRGQNLYFYEQSGKEFKISGVLLSKLKQLAGSKVWLLGDLKKTWFFGYTYTLEPNTYQIIRKGNEMSQSGNH